MCLWVTHVPTSRKAARCVKVKKWADPIDGQFQTPYQDKVTVEGWLACNRSTSLDGCKSMWKGKMYAHDLIGPGVHSYEVGSSQGTWHRDAYAIGVAAYESGYENELVSGMLYIPEGGTPEMTRLVKAFYKSPTKTNFKKIMAALPKDKEIQGAARRVLKGFFK